MRGAAIVLASASLAACTIFWPIDSYELGPADASGGADGASEATIPEGGATDGGAFTVTSFATVPSPPILLALNATHVFVVGEDQKVTRIDKKSGLVETLPTPSLGPDGRPLVMRALAASDTYLFLAGDENSSCGAPVVAFKRSVADAGAFEPVLNGACALAGAIAHDLLDYMVAVNYGATSSLVQHPLAGGGNVTVAQSLPEALAMASLPDEVYLASASAKRLVRIPKSGDGGIDLATTVSAPRDIAVDANNVYWIEVDGLVAFKPRKAPSSDPATTVAQEPVGLAYLAADATRLYFTNLVDGTVKSVLKSGGVVETIASDQAKAGRIAVDDTHVYWARTGNPEIIRSTKK